MSSKQARLIVDGPNQGSWNMAADQAILETANVMGLVTLRFYLWEPATVSLGYFQAIGDRDGHEPSRGCPLVRRATGGGAIVHDQELTYSFCAPRKSRWASENQELYTQVHAALIHCLSDFGVSAQLFSEANQRSKEPFLCFQRRASGDVICKEFKICGSAQRRVDNAILQHGSILLNQSDCAPELPGCNDLENAAVQVDELRNALTKQLEKEMALDFVDGQMSPSELDRAKEIQRNRFQNDAWNAKR